MEPRVVISEPHRPSITESARKVARRDSSNVSRPEKSTLIEEWDLTSWQSRPIVQDVKYQDPGAVEAAVSKLESLPPLVHPNEIEKLQSRLAEAARGERFVLQGGDCAELFDYCCVDRIEGKLKVLLQMSLVLIHGLRLPILRVGRIAGQYGKPRSSPTEIVPGHGELPSFRGDNINGFAPDARTPDPERLVQAYFHSAATLNYIRLTLSNGFADLHKPETWDLSYFTEDAPRKRYQQVVDTIADSMDFMKVIGDSTKAADSIEFYTAHEAMLLEYEQSLTRQSNGKWYNTSAHFVWIGDRTRQLDGAHVEFFRGIANPIGIKVGPSMDTDELVRLLDIVDPNKVDGKVTLITRYGADKIASKLPSQIKAVKSSGHTVVWISDPCHGNTKVSPKTKLKTRYFNDIVSELTQALEIHSENDSMLNGVHLELTGDAVTECIGGFQELEDEELVLRYDTVCDPRLSYSQSLDVAFLLADHVKNLRKSRQLSPSV